MYEVGDVYPRHIGRYFAGGSNRKVSHGLGVDSTDSELPCTCNSRSFNGTHSFPLNLWDRQTRLFGARERKIDRQISQSIMDQLWEVEVELSKIYLSKKSSHRSLVPVQLTDRMM